MEFYFDINCFYYFQCLSFIFVDNYLFNDIVLLLIKLMNY